MSSFFPHAISSSRIIISHFEDFPSFDSLKDHVLSLVRPVNKSMFGVHDPLGLRYFFQFRVSLSPLRSHKSRHNFISLIPLLISVIVNKASKIQVIFYSSVLPMLLTE